MTPSLFPPNPILVVDDEPDILKGFQMALGSAGINNLLLCQDSRKIMPILLENKIEVILLDLIMPNIPGEELLSMISDDFPDIPVIIITGNTQVDMAVRCMKNGTFDYMVKPVEKKRLVSGVERAIEIRRLQNENQLLKEHILSGELKNPESFSEFNTQNRSMTGLFQYAESIAQSSHPVLITGETGVGKELLARAIHTLSCRKGPLITVNAAGIDDNTFSDTLFGHIRGAFTGADKVRKGMVEHAFGGSLFLDEIGDLKPDSQVKLLRLLQEREYFPLGADLPQIADIKIIAATNRDLAELQESGQFRKDLYYRLCFHNLHIPPLRERLNDLPLLMSHFFEETAREFGKKTPTSPLGLINLLSNYHYPGNIRELKSMIYDAVASHHSKIMAMKRFEAHIKKRSPFGTTIPELFPAKQSVWFPDSEPIPTLEKATHLLVAEAMKRSGENQTMAARFLGISRQRLGRYLKAGIR
ncbi:MAG: sigma-54 dependent transcriptional regulator [Desulfobacula sp.]|jgi:DNA-binding NtrC family response regulator|nr:sigma-54 dependent transcriptional regulator [Desulfobacula sp.]